MSRNFFLRAEKIALAVSLTILFLATFAAHAEPNNRAQTDTGTVEGLAANGIVSFRGIPYAAPPLGALRWHAPEPSRPWQGVLKANAWGPACMQVDDIPKSEDCLTLNIWKPAQDRAAPFPVMVWIYGGALVHGRTAMYPGDALARQGVIVVSMNYRVGRLGFFAHPALVAEAGNEPVGNYGYMDQIAALKWVQRNIGAFHGDPKNVTLFGESAGGGSVLVHLTSPLSRGLFQKAILQSAGLPSPRAQVMPLTELPEAEKIATEYAHSLGVNGNDAAALAKLRQLPADKLVTGAAAGAEVVALATNTRVPGVAGPIRDGRLIVESPDAALADAHFAKVPVMIGANDNDLPLGAAHSKEELFANFGAYATTARKLYDPKGDTLMEELQQDVFADRTMVEPARHLAEMVTRTATPVFLYRFSYVIQSRRDADKGVLHAFEIPFVFGVPEAFVGDMTSPSDRAMAKLASAYWVSFAQTGDPNGGDRPRWPRFDAASGTVFNFANNGAQNMADPIKPRLDLWRSVWEEGRYAGYPRAAADKKPQSYKADQADKASSAEKVEQAYRAQRSDKPADKAQQADKAPPADNAQPADKTPEQ
jgi:para-nitrobenzyl esterase